MTGSDIYTEYSGCIITVIAKVNTTDYLYGSGFFIRKNGYVVTAAHNCIDTKKITVLYSNALLKARLVGIDKRTDIALLKIKAENNPYLKFNEEENVKSGDKCYILGNHTDSAKCISHIGNVKFDKYLSNEVFESIVVDVNVNKGTSGSPIINSKGFVIGMINWFMDRDCSGGVTANYINKVTDLLISDDFNKAYIGLKTKKLKLQDIIHHNINMAQKNVRGEILTEDSEETGLQKNDIIVSVNDNDVGVLDSNIESIVYLMPVGEEVIIKYYKFSPLNGMSWNTREYEKTVKLVEYPESLNKMIIGKCKIKMN